MQLKQFTEEILKEIEKTVDSVFGLMTALPMAYGKLELNVQQISIFCKNTPNGEELWDMFTARRDSEETSKDYGFEHFMKDVLTKAGHPLKTETSLEVLNILMKNMRSPNGFKFNRQEDTMLQDLFTKKATPEIFWLSRKKGRNWKLYTDFQIGVSQEQFFKCSLRDNEEMTMERQKEELEKSEKILCVGCNRTNNRTPLCIGHMLRKVWVAEHPDQHSNSRMF